MSLHFFSKMLHAQNGTLGLLLGMKTNASALFKAVFCLLNIFGSQRNVDLILNRISKKKKVYFTFVDISVT